MSNKRTLKKRIQQLCGAAAVEVMMHLDAPLAHKTVISLARLQSNALRHVTFSFDRSYKDFATRKDYNKARHDYTKAAFDKLKKDFNEQLKAIVAEINASITSAKS